MDFFKYGEEEMDYLKKKDELLAAVIERIGIIEREVTPDLFKALIHSIIGQQISTKAATTIRNRLLDKVPNINPDDVVALSIEEIQSNGLSIRKAGYIKIVPLLSLMVLLIWLNWLICQMRKSFNSYLY